MGFRRRRCLERVLACVAGARGDFGAPGIGCDYGSHFLRQSSSIAGDKAEPSERGTANVSAEPANWITPGKPRGTITT
jgi:hypothetical protein